jgi:hypothetical protein
MSVISGDGHVKNNTLHLLKPCIRSFLYIIGTDTRKSVLWTRTNEVYGLTSLKSRTHSVSLIAKQC